MPEDWRYWKYLKLMMINDVKKMRCAFIAKPAADDFIKRWHYSGKVTQNSQINCGFFNENNRLIGVIQFGPSIDKRRMIGLVANTSWNGFLEINRMAFIDNTPKNTESRALAISIKMLKKKFPFLKWLVTFADGCQCGDGTIYRAAGFHLIGVKKNKSLIQLPDGEIIAGKSIDDLGPKTYEICKRYGIDPAIGYRIKTELYAKGAKPLKGYQIKYIKFLDSEYKKHLTVDILDYSELDRLGARMYKGEKCA